MQLESAATSHQILLNTVPLPEKHSVSYPSAAKSKKSGPSKKKKKKSAAPKKPAHSKSEPSKHYRLNLADIPFVAGKVSADFCAWVVWDRVGVVLE